MIGVHRLARVAAVVLLPASVAVFSMIRPLWASDAVFDARGNNPNREFVSELPFEHIDPMTGNLLLTFTDLELPGNAGFALRVQRTYNSKIYSYYSNAGGYLLGEDSWAGLGWTLHFGRVTHCSGPAPLCPPGPVIEMPDGSQHQAYPHKDGDSEHFMTRDFWTLDTTNRDSLVLRLPDGTKYTYGHVVLLGTTEYLCSDLDPGRVRQQCHHHVHDGRDRSGGRHRHGDAERQPRRDADHPVRDGPHDRGSERGRAVADDGDTARADEPDLDVHAAALHRLEMPLARLLVPDGGAAARRPVVAVRLRPGRVAADGLDDSLRRDSCVHAHADLVLGRIDGHLHAGCHQARHGRDGHRRGHLDVRVPVAGAGIDRHDGDKPNVQRRGLDDRVHVRRRSDHGVRVEHRHAGEEETTDTSGNSRIEELTWQPSDPIATYQEGPSIETHAPLLQRRKVTLSGGATTYQATYSYSAYPTYSKTRAANFSDFGRPFQIVESGDLSRTTTRSLWYPTSSDPSFGTLIVDRPSSETVTVGGESFAKSWAYSSVNGFKTSETIYGIATTFTPSSDGTGDVWKATDAHGHVRLYEYDWGQVARLQTPSYNPLLTRVINADGTIESETRRGYTTSFQYDALMRRTLVTPPVGNSQSTQYDLLNGSRYTRVTRDSSRTDAYVDGFGRPSRTVNGQGVNTDTSFDARGRTRYQSLPYCTTSGCSGGTSNVGATYDYDGLGRVTKRTNADGSSVSYAYSNGIDVTITNERSKATLQNWSAFGSPEDARLVAVTDADSKAWSYSYNALGSLRTVTPPVGSARTWTYYGAEAGGRPGLLKSETHPEGGAVSYTYDAAGLMKTRTDAQFGATSFTYDTDERLTFIDRPGTTYDTTLAWDASDNRTSLANGAVNSAFTYDGANRLTQRRDTIDTRVFTTVFHPDANDNLEQIDYPSGLQVKYQFDSENRITDVGKPGVAGTWARSFSYHPSGATASFTAGNGKVHTQTFTSRYWPDLVSSGAVSLDYGYDNAGNVTSINDTRGNQTYGYDNVDRILAASGQWGSGSFAYDAAGNRTSKTVAGASTTYTINSTTGRLTSASGAEPASYGYDANGNLTNDGRAYTYVPTNMLETAADVTYRYDGDELRKVKTPAGGPSEYFIHGQGGAILSQMASPSCSIKDYVYLGGRLLAAVKPALPSVSLTAAAQTVTEGAGVLVPVTVQVTNTGGCAALGPITVNYATSNGKPPSPGSTTRPCRARSPSPAAPCRAAASRRSPCRCWPTACPDLRGPSRSRCSPRPGQSSPHRRHRRSRFRTTTFRSSARRRE